LFFLPRVSRFAPCSPVEALQWGTVKSVQLSSQWLSPELVRHNLTNGLSLPALHNKRRYTLTQPLSISAQVLGQVCLGNHEEPHRAAERALKTYGQGTLVFKVKGGNQAMTCLFIPALLSLAVIASSVLPKPMCRSVL
jgi:hypothetical protein